MCVMDFYILKTSANQPDVARNRYIPNLIYDSQPLFKNVDETFSCITIPIHLFCNKLNGSQFVGFCLI